jgi:hypothetical protein
MTIIIGASIFFALGIAAYFLLLMADGRKLRERMSERRPSFISNEPQPEEPLIASDYSSWMAPPFRSATPPGLGGRGSLYSTTPELPGTD